MNLSDKLIVLGEQGPDKFLVANSMAGSQRFPAVGRTACNFGLVAIRGALRARSIWLGTRGPAPKVLASGRFRFLPMHDRRLIWYSFATSLPCERLTVLSLEALSRDGEWTFRWKELASGEVSTGSEVILAVPFRGVSQHYARLLDKFLTAFPSLVNLPVRGRIICLPDMTLDEAKDVAKQAEKTLCRWLPEVECSPLLTPQTRDDPRA